MKKLLLISLLILAFSCDKKKDNPTPALATNTINLCGTPDTTEYTPQLIDGYLTCYINGVFYKSDPGQYLADILHGDTVSISAVKNTYNPSLPQEHITLVVYNYNGLGAYCFNGTEINKARMQYAVAPNASSSYNAMEANFENGNSIAITGDAAHKLQGYFYGKVKDNQTGDTIRISSGRFSLNY
jgi:hypothetical protein